MIFTYPIGVYYALFDRLVPDGFAKEKPMRHREVGAVYVRASFCMAANSPITMLIYLIEVTLLLVLLLPVSRVIREAVHHVVSSHTATPFEPKNHGSVS
jgi:hypothetical protein